MGQGGEGTKCSAIAGLRCGGDDIHINIRRGQCEGTAS